MKINAIRTAIIAAAMTIPASSAALNYLQKQNNTILEKFENPRDEFVRQAKSNDYVVNSKTDEINNISSINNSSNPDFEKAIDYYNKKMNYNQRYDVTTNTYDNLQTRLYNMEKAINQAYIDCEAYSDINIVPRWYYRFYPYFEDKLINFDIDNLRERTTNDMESLHELKDKIAYIIEEANGETTHKEPTKTEYDVDILAQKHFGMSYAEFSETYKNELDFCKTVTYADLIAMNETQRYVYAKAKAYAKEMLLTTINEAHVVNWDTGEKKLEETLKASGDMYIISEFEDDGITNENLSQIQSGIMFKAFEDALLNKYYELNINKTDNISNTKIQSKLKKSVKYFKNGKVIIVSPNDSSCDLNGQKLR